jgi:hypothetical protein
VATPRELWSMNPYTPSPTFALIAFDHGRSVLKLACRSQGSSPTISTLLALESCHPGMRDSVHLAKGTDMVEI